ncbi:trypsin-like cysteine/serine peptidase domain-containing protein [Hyaloraphidium curvatum]|nr:trypsin-like cysteine/serine peptidase domain-containing protein [Hyaloraphidium curvatum]
MKSPRRDARPARSPGHRAVPVPSGAARLLLLAVLAAALGTAAAANLPPFGIPAPGTWQPDPVADIAGGTPSAPPPGIVGGGIVTNTNNTYPWMSYIYNSRFGIFCGGTLIAPRVLLTAASCVTAFAPSPFLAPQYWIVESRRLVLSKTAAQEGALAFTVLRIEVHPLFNANGKGDSDAALMFLSEPTNSGQLAPQSVALNADPGLPANAQVVRTLGWGQVTQGAGGTRSDTLQAVDVQAANNETCTAYYNPPVPLDPSLLCAGLQDKGICFGDTGGPLLQDVGGTWVQVGIAMPVSGSFCAGQNNFLGYFTRLSSVFPWIDSMLALENGTFTRTTTTSRSTTVAASTTRITRTTFPPAPGETVVCSYPTAPIPDNGVITSSIRVSGFGNPTEVEVIVGLSHENMTDVSIQLSRTPDGRRIKLYDGTASRCGGRDFSVITFSDSAPRPIDFPSCGSTPGRPFDSLSPFVGSSANADWDLVVLDSEANAKAGFLDHWCLVLRRSLPTSTSSRTRTSTTSKTSTTTVCPFPTTTTVTVRTTVVSTVRSTSVSTSRTTITSWKTSTQTAGTKTISSVVTVSRTSTKVLSKTTTKTIAKTTIFRTRTKTVSRTKTIAKTTVTVRKTITRG